MRKLKLIIGIGVLVVILGACSLKQYDSYGIVSFLIKNVE